MDIEFDPTKAKANLQKHKVSFSHAEQALSAILSRSPSKTLTQKQSSGS